MSLERRALLARLRRDDPELDRLLVHDAFEAFLQSQQGGVDRVLEREVVVIPGRGTDSELTALIFLDNRLQLSQTSQSALIAIQPTQTHRFSRNVFALTWFLPIALAFHAQNEPEGSTWYNVWPRALSKPATRSETPNGRTPL